VKNSDTVVGRLSGNRIGRKEVCLSKPRLKKYCWDEKYPTGRGDGGLPESENARNYFLPAFFAAQ
jgi:hypothetical protein